MDSSKYLVPSLVLSLAFIIGSFLLGSKWVESRTPERYVTVKGLSERKVKSNSAWYSINTQFGANNTQEIQTQIAWLEKEIRSYLTKYKFTEDEINVASININANNYENATSKYNANVSISVNTDKIEKVQAASKSISDLISKGILVQTDNWAAGPKYYFTEFKTIKTDMIAEATKEAKKSANEFAKNSGSTVGKIKRANQGVFQILPGNQTQENEVFYVDKWIRVVSTFDYYLE